MKCQACDGTGGGVEHRPDLEAWAFVRGACPDCEGAGRIPDPCPVCGSHGHAMAPESGPGPLCVVRS